MSQSNRPWTRRTWTRRAWTQRVRSGTSSRFFLPFAIFAAVFAILLIVRRLATARWESDFPDILAILLLAQLVTLLLLLAVGATLRIAGYDAEADEAAAHLAHDSLQQQLIGRWFNRMRWYRFVGGLSGIAVWLFGRHGQGGLLVCGTLGIVIGAIAAESYQLRRATGPRSATLEVRKLSSYLTRGDAIRMGVVAVVGLATAIAGVVVPDHRPAIAAGLASVLIIGVVHLVQRRVVSRGRPAVGDDLRWADDLTRRLAVGPGLAIPAACAGLAFDAAGLADLAQTTSGMTNVAGYVALAAWIYAAALWWRNRGLAVGRLHHRVSEVAIA